MDEMMVLEQAYEYLFTIGLVIMCVLTALCFVRVVKGPRVADRLVSIDMIGTITIMALSILTVYMDESYLVDISLVYAMLSFLAVIVLVKVYLGVYRKRHVDHIELEGNDDDLGMD